MDIEKRFKKIVADIFRVNIKKIKDSTDYVDDLHAKSIDVIALIAATENEFQIKTPSQEANKNTTVGQTIAYLKKKLKSK